VEERGGSLRSESAVTRASALTLLVYVDREESAREVSNMLAEVTQQNPCRAVLMVMDPRDTSRPDGYPFGHCHRAESGEKQICSEQITLNARVKWARAHQRRASPYGFRAADLPLVAAESFAMPAYFDHILRMTEHVIVDSASFAATGADLRH